MAAILLATIAFVLPATATGSARVSSPAAAAPLDAPTCGQVGEGIFRFDGSSVDPVLNEEFRVGDRTYASADFHRATLAVFELAWLAREDVCVDEDSAQKPVAAGASVEVCGDVLIGATVWLFQTGTGELDANGATNERRGFIDGTLMGFVALSLGGDPTPPNFFSTLKIAARQTEPDDCLAASVSWTAPNDPVVAATLSATDCLVADMIDAGVARFIEPVESSVHPFSLTPGSSIDPGLEPGDRGGVTITSARGLDGSVAIAPVHLDGCLAGPVNPPETPTPSPTAPPTPAPSGSESANPASPAVAPSTPTTDGSTAPVTSPTQSGGAVAAGLGTPTSPPPIDPSGVAATLPQPVLGLIVAALLALAAIGMLRQFVLRRPAAADHALGPASEDADGTPEPIVTRPAPVLLERLGLTAREREVLAMVASGMSNREIGSALFITESTAGVHVSNILGKLGVGSRTEAARYAIDAGILPSSQIGPVH